MYEHLKSVVCMNTLSYTLKHGGHKSCLAQQHDTKGNERQSKVVTFVTLRFCPLSPLVSCEWKYSC